MKKSNITRTFGPIHFEDLDPHRFEDLIRELIYDYKEWQSIEATGRSGSDEGFDVRAYEKAETISHLINDDNEDIIETHPMEGNLWMIQGKREKEIGPQKIMSILSYVDPKNPPYGYILAASTNFSKKAYDLFRQELRKKGVMEFYIWGKAELEDMLHLPKNDRILFTFFGFSLVSKRRSRITEIRSAVNIKNKLFRMIGEGQNLNKLILLRDLKDINYPNEKQYGDFKTKPRWNDFNACGHHPLGLWCYTQECFAYIDIEKKEYDYTKEIDLTYHKSIDEDNDKHNKHSEKRDLINDFWDFLPRKNKGYFLSLGLIKYIDIALLDDKGDVNYDIPHIYVEFNSNMEPFSKYINFIKINNNEIDITEDYKRINIFPDRFKKEKIKKIYRDKRIVLNTESQKEFKNYLLDTIFETSNKYEFLNTRDVIQIENQGNELEDIFIQITYKLRSTAKVYIEQSIEPFKTKKSIELQLGRIPEDNEEINIYEFNRISKWKFEKE